jgi:spoIIIJ-associated protein
MKPKKILALVKDTLEELLPLMKVDADVSYTYVKDESPSVKVDFAGEELGYLIGARGTHLKALQFIVSLIVNKKVREKDEDAPRVFVNMDVGGYRQEKIDQIGEQAMQVAEDARASGESIDMRPMSPADRRIVHMVLGEVKDITTDSQGEGRDRYVRVTAA